MQRWVQALVFEQLPSAQPGGKTKWDSEWVQTRQGWESKTRAFTINPATGSLGFLIYSRVNITTIPTDAEGNPTGEPEVTIGNLHPQIVDLESETGIEPQNSRDPRVDFRNYAFMLSGNGENDDCLKLALMVYKAGQAWGGDPIRVVSGLLNGLTERAGVFGDSDPSYRVGVMRRDPYYGNSFGSGGFLPQHQGPPGDNQVRHFIGWFGAGFTVPSVLARQELYSQEGTSDPRDPDVALGLAGIQMGSNYNIVSNYENYKDLAQSIWRDICGGKGELKLP